MNGSGSNMGEVELRDGERARCLRRALFPESIEKAALNASPAHLNGANGLMAILNHGESSTKTVEAEGLVLGNEHYEAGQSR
jgi:hypothetical protein